MARQKGIIKIKGALGDIAFGHGAYGFTAQQKTSIDKERVMTDEAFQRTRENGAEFGRAGLGGKLIRTAFRPMIKKATDRGMVGRMLKHMLRVVKSDATHDRGLRTATDGELGLLTGFNFNEDAKLGTTLFVPFTASIDRASGKATVTLPGFVPLHMITKPEGATHFRLLASAAEVDFEVLASKAVLTETADIPLDANQLAATTLELQLPAGSVHGLLLAFGIEFSQEVNGKHYPLNTGTFAGSSIVAAERVP